MKINNMLLEVIANKLYENIKNETNKSLDLYVQLDAAFVRYKK